MANPEHVEILKKDIDTWREWREVNEKVKLDLRDADLKGVNMSARSLVDADFSFANLENANLGDSDLRRASLHETRLVNAYLKEAVLEGADLAYANLSGANLSSARMKGASLRRSNCSGVDLTYTDLRSADLRRVNLQSSDLENANLKKTNLAFASFENTNLSGIKFGSRRRSYFGIHLDGCHGSERFRRYVLHQSFVHEMAVSNFANRLLVGLWNVLADCGRTPWTWIIWAVVFVWFYAIVFWGMGCDAFSTDHLEFSLETMLYYSTVTFTTLGFGDITPKTAEAARWVMAEVITGYVMLGGLISFIFSKLLPRG